MESPLREQAHFVILKMFRGHEALQVMAREGLRKGYLRKALSCRLKQRIGYYVRVMNYEVKEP